MANEVSRSWFCVFNNPASHGYDGEPIEILEQLRDEWVTDDKSERTGAWLYCISENGLHHVHMVLEDKKPMRFSVIKKSYAVGMHFESTKGTKEQVTAYIEKIGDFEEKGEQIIAKVTHGEIMGRVKKEEVKRSIFDDIQDLLDAGLTPSEILAIGIKYARHERAIRTAFIAKCAKDIPVVKKMQVYWHLGNYNGLTNVYKGLCDEYGEKNVYLVNDYANNGNAAFDDYADTFSSVLCIDNYKGEFPYEKFLAVLGRKKCQLHARYTNVYNRYTIVHVVSQYTMFQVYNMAVPAERHQEDPYSRLLECIDYVVYHYKVDGTYKTYQIPATGFTSTVQIHNDALAAYQMAKEFGFECTAENKQGKGGES